MAETSLVTTAINVWLTCILEALYRMCVHSTPSQGWSAPALPARMTIPPQPRDCKGALLPGLDKKREVWYNNSIKIKETMMNESQANALFASFTPHPGAARMDAAAMADPTKYSSQEDKLARFLANWLDYDYRSYHHRLKKKARELLEHSKGDVDGMWEMVEAKARDGQFAAWVTEKDVNIYAVTNILKDAYSRRLMRERKRAASGTTAGRVAKYVTPGVQS